ncbi:hypothetical protein [Brevibacillus parabrevis]
MEFLSLTKHNIESEHVCCAFGAKQYEKAVAEKKDWLDELHVSRN